MAKLSPSSLHLLDECPRCFWLQHNKGIKRPEGVFPSLPGGMDKVLKEHFDKHREKGEVPPELAGLSGVKLFEDAEKLAIWSNNRKGITWTDEKGNILRGAVDYLLTKGNKLIVLDFKTRGYPTKEDTPEFYQNQLNIYNFLLRKNGYQTEDHAYLLFYHPESVDADCRVKFHPELVRMNISVKDAEELFRKALKVLAGEMPKPSEKCKFCAWQQMKL